MAARHKRLMSLQGGRGPLAVRGGSRPELTVIAGERKSIPASARPQQGQEDAPTYRYRRPDMLTQIPRGLGVLAFGLDTLAVLYYARAQYVQGDPRPFGVSSFLSIFSFRGGSKDVDTAAYLAGAACVMSGVGLLISSRRMRREGDHYGRASIAIFVLSGLAVLAYVARMI